MFALKIRFACAAVGLGGLAYLVALSIYLIPGLALTGSNHNVTLSSDVRHHRWFGTEYQIQVGGETFWCSGGDAGEERARGTPVVYDPVHPERCRAEAMLGRLGVYELVAALTSGAFVAAGLAVTALWRHQRARTLAFAFAVLLGWSDVLLAFIIHRGASR
jgi:hypothetical protein